MLTLEQHRVAGSAEKLGKSQINRIDQHKSTLSAQCIGVIDNATLAKPVLGFDGTSQRYYSELRTATA